jgi:hypothetical protein
MYNNETPHKMFNRLKKLVNMARALGLKKWSDRMLMERLMMTYTLMIYNVVSLIRQDSTYKKMASDDVLRRIMNHEMNIQEANNIKNLYKGVSSYKEQDIALKASNKNKKKAIIESQSEEEGEEEEEDEDKKEYDEDKVALFIKKFNKFIKKRRPYKGDRREKPRSKIVCYNYGKNGHLIAHMRGKRKAIRRKRSLTKATRKIRNSQRISPMVKFMLVKNRTQVMRVLSRKVMMWKPSPSRVKLHQASHSFQTSPCTRASWQRKVKRR